MSVLCKFFSNEEYMNEFRSGKIYLKSLSWYRKVEAKEGQRDIFEGCEYVLAGKNAEVFFDNVKIEQVVHVREERVGFSDDIKAACFFMAQEISKNKFHFTEEMKKFGKYIVMITDNVKFEQMLYNYSQQYPELQMICKKCEYIPEDELTGRYGPFVKRDTYKDQNEWRICVNKHTSEDYTYIDIGDISDISIVLDGDKLFGV